MRRFLADFGLFLLLFLNASCSSAAGTPFSKAPDFTLPALADGAPVVFSEANRENPVLLIFWASWCPSCVEEIPELKEIQEKFSARGLKILAVNVEEPRETVLKFQKEQAIHYPIVLDEKGDVAQKFGLVGLPVAVLVQTGGRVAYFGFSLPSDLESLLQPNKKGTA